MISKLFAMFPVKLGRFSQLKQLSLIAALLSGGYVLGTLDVLQLPASWAQGPKTPELDEQVATITISNDAIKQIQGIHETLAAAMETLKLEGQYTSATEGLNPYLILTGGGNAIDDLERGFGVDPVTFAQLYAGQAVREVQDELSKDEQGRLLYKNRLIRIYSVERLQKQQEMAQAILEKRVLP